MKMKIKANITIYLIQYPNGEIKFAFKPFPENCVILKTIQVNIDEKVNEPEGKFKFDYSNINSITWE